jgi:hypothetical protein
MGEKINAYEVLTERPEEDIGRAWRGHCNGSERKGWGTWTEIIWLGIGTNGIFFGAWC